jgi:hypothetical protein
MCRSRTPEMQDDDKYFSKTPVENEKGGSVCRVRRRMTPCLPENCRTAGLVVARVVSFPGALTFWTKGEKDVKTSGVASRRSCDRAFALRLRIGPGLGGGIPSDNYEYISLGLECRALCRDRRFFG